MVILLKRYLKNESGLTLIELLATIVIGSIVLILATSVMVSATKQNKIVYEHNSLRQEANLIITKLRQIHQEEMETYTLCFKEDSRLYINGNLLGNENYSFTTLEIESGSEKLSSLSTDCLENIKVTEPLLIDFTLTNSSGQELDLNTAIQRIEPLPPTLNSNDDNISDPPNNIIIEEFPLIEGENENYTNANLNNCNKLTKDTNKNIVIASHFDFKNGNCKDNITFDKSLKFDTNQNTPITLPNDMNLIVKSNLFSNDILILESSNNLRASANIKVTNDAKFNKNITLKNSSHIFIGGNLESQSSFLMETETDLYVEKNAKFNKLTIDEDAEVYIGENLYIDSSFEVDGNVYVAGDAVFDTNVQVVNFENICVEGQVEIKNPAYKHLATSLSCNN